jgi:hypothetical protein
VEPGLDPALAGHVAQVDRVGAGHRVVAPKGHQQRVVAQVDQGDAVGRQHPGGVVAHDRDVERA